MPFDVSLPFFPKQDPFIKQLADSIPMEGVTFVVASLAMRVFSVTLSTPLLGIGLSIIAARLFLKAIDPYAHRLVVDLTKEACRINRAYPNLQTMAFIAALAISFTSQSLSLFIGVSLGTFGSIVLDVERHKLLQQWNRLGFG